MNLTYLRSFYVTVQSNSISRAAKHLHLTQPGLSMQLQNLENELAVKLLTRSNKGVELTSEGKIVYEFADSMLSLEDSLDEKLKSISTKKSKLFISCCKSLGEDVLPCSMYTFKEIYFNVDISMEIDSSFNIIKNIENHKLNIGIIQCLKDSCSNIELVKIMSDKLILVGNSNSDLDKISLDDLSKVPLILREDGSSTLKILENNLSNHSKSLKDLNVVMSLNSPASIKSSILSGRGFSFMPELSIKHELRNKKLKVIHIEDFETTFDYYIAYRKNYSLNENEENFVKFLTSKKRCFCY